MKNAADSKAWYDQGRGICGVPGVFALEGVIIAEIFQIKNGLISQVEAVLLSVPYRMRPGWDPQAESILLN